MRSTVSSAAANRFRCRARISSQIETDAPLGASRRADAAGCAGCAVGGTLQELRRRVETLPEVAGVAFLDRLPGKERPEVFELPDDGSVYGQMAVVPETGASPPSLIVTLAAVEPSYFDALGAPIAAGRALTAADAAPGVNVAIVDQGFVDLGLQGRHPLSRWRSTRRCARLWQP